MNNREWLYSLDVADLSDWFDAEHVETEERALDGDTAALNAKYDGDSREKLEADVYRAADEMDRFYCGEKFIDTRKIIGWLDRQAAITQHEITERWAEHLHPIERKCGDLRRKVDELTAERDKLQELNEYHALQYELASEDCDRLQAEVDTLKAERVKLRSQICKLEDDLVRTSDERDNWKANCEDWKKDCERYRSKFGKCLDYADAIHALMDDEGMA